MLAKNLGVNVNAGVFVDPFVDFKHCPCFRCVVDDVSDLTNLRFSFDELTLLSIQIQVIWLGDFLYEFAAPHAINVWIDFASLDHPPEARADDIQFNVYLVQLEEIIVQYFVLQIPKEVGNALKELYLASKVLQFTVVEVAEYIILNVCQNVV